jgi:hypothetical protein
MAGKLNGQGLWSSLKESLEGMCKRLHARENMANSYLRLIHPLYPATLQLASNHSHYSIVAIIADVVAASSAPSIHLTMSHLTSMHVSIHSLSDIGPAMTALRITVSGRLNASRELMMLQIMQ